MTPISIGNYTLTISETTNPGVEPAPPVPRNTRSYDSDNESTEIMELPFPPLPGPPLNDEERALLALIHDAPERNEPRLVYADWLIQRGDPRGELIALQCLHGTDDADATENRRKIQQLLHTHASHWLAPLQPAEPFHCSVDDGLAAISLTYNDGDSDLLRAHINRGFLAHPLCVDAAQLAVAAPLVFRLSPTVCQIGQQVATPYSTVHHALFRGQIIGPHGAGADVAVRSSSAAAALDDPRNQGYPNQRQATSYLWFHSWHLGSLFQHANIARTHGLAYWGRAGDLALLSEWIDGVSLKALLQHTRTTYAVLPEYALAAIGVQCLRAIEHMRAIESDGLGVSLATAKLTLTPDHLVVARDGTVKLVELPWSELLFQMQGGRAEDWWSGHMDHAPYAAPELRATESDQPPCDSYHVASLLYQLAGGELPGYRPTQVAHELNAILRRAMADAPNDRYPTVSAMRQDLTRAFESHWQRRSGEGDGHLNGRAALASALAGQLAASEWA